MLDKLTNAASSYYESEMERWEDTKEDPAGTFFDNLQFGLTGPAPSVGDGGEIDYGSALYESINKGAYEDFVGGAPENVAGSEARFQAITLIAVGLVVIYTIGQLVTFTTEV